MMTDLQHIKRISIRDYLALQGIEPKQQNTRYGLYLSPLREEHSPSFKVDYIQNLWYDFGLGEGGSIIDLVMRLERCTLHKPFDCLTAVRKQRSLLPYRHRFYGLYLRFAFYPKHRYVIRHWSVTSRRVALLQLSLLFIAERYDMK